MLGGKFNVPHSFPGIGCGYAFARGRVLNDRAFAGTAHGKSDLGGHGASHGAGNIAQCRANGYRVSVSIIDNAGLLKAFLRDDGSGAGTPDLSRSKAYTALFFRRTSGETAKAFGAMTPPPNVAGTVLMQGGVPIKVGTDTIGAIGVSGAPGGDKDEVCANAGIAKVADKLK